MTIWPVVSGLKNIGWIRFQSANPDPYKVQTFWITTCIVDSGSFVMSRRLWLQADYQQHLKDRLL